MKIGFDAKRAFHNTTGLGNYSRDLIRILATYYPDNQYYLYNPKRPKINRLQMETNMIMRQPTSLMDRIFPSIWRSKGILKDLKKDNLDIFHGLSGELPLNINKTGIKSVVSIHDLIFLRFPELYKPIDRKIYTAKFKSAIKNADIVVAISETTKKDIIHFFATDENKIKVIYQGCHHAFKQSYSPEQKKQVIKKYQLPKQFVLNVGTLEERKNALTIVKSLKNTDLHLVLVGRETPYTKQIHDFVTQNNMSQRVHFLKNLSLQELAILYQLASLFVYPSIYEGFGIPIIEALYSKTPVITQQKGVFPEAGGPDSFYIQNTLDEKELQNKILEVLQQDNAEIVDKNWQFAQKFNDENIATQWQNLYKNLIDK